MTRVLALTAGAAVTLAALTWLLQHRTGLLDRLAEHVTYTEGLLTS